MKSDEKARLILSDFKIGKRRSGYIYAPQGIDPNRAGGELVARSRPLESMGEGWYRARKIAYGFLK